MDSMNKSRSDQLVSIPTGTLTPFNYSSLTYVRVYFEADPGALRQAALPDGLKAYVVEGKHVASVAYQGYLADFGSEAATIRELELSVMAAPRDFSIALTWDELLHGSEQSASVGFCPQMVLCDARVAISAGREIFGEVKEYADFVVDVPAPNRSAKVWNVTATCLDAASVALTVQLNGIELDLKSNGGWVTYTQRGGEALASKLALFGRVWSGRISRDQASVETKGGTDGPEVSARFSSLDFLAPVAVEALVSEPVAYRGRPYLIS